MVLPEIEAPQLKLMALSQLLLDGATGNLSTKPIQALVKPTTVEASSDIARGKAKMVP